MAAILSDLGIKSVKPVKMGVATHHNTTRANTSQSNTPRATLQVEEQPAEANLVDKRGGDKPRKRGCNNSRKPGKRGDDSSGRVEFRRETPKNC